MCSRIRSKAILKVVGIAVFAAMFCIGCSDNTDDGGIDSTYTITFDPNGGTVTPTSGTLTFRSNGGGVKWDEALIHPPTPTLDGYAFTGWYTEKTGGELITNVSAIAHANRTLYAHWAIAHYRITFDAHGGDVTPHYAMTGDDWTLASLPTPTMADHEFVGWYKDVVGEREHVYDTTTYKENTTLYAHWVYNREHYKVTFDAAGGDVDPASEETDVGGKLQELPEPTKEEYAFIGWYTAETGGEKVTTETEFTAPATIYARWVLFTSGMRIVTFDAHGGTVRPKSGVTDESGRLLAPLPLPTPTREGYTFQGWFTEDGGVTASTVFKADTTKVHAQWAMIHYTITFNANGGTVSPTSGTTGIHWELADLPTPTRDGYTFVGWYTEESGGAHVVPSMALIDVHEIYAHWTDTPPSFADSRDGKGYREVAIGEQIWMAENLNYAGEAGNELGLCYNYVEDSCSKYGRLYSWDEALVACPVGWHLPSDAEWTELLEFVEGLSSMGTATKLKATTGWYCSPSMGVPCGTDYVGFSALPAGDGYYKDGALVFGGEGAMGDLTGWWSTTERDGKPEEAYTRDIIGGDLMGQVLRHNYDKQRLFSVRCVQD